MPDTTHFIGIGGIGMSGLARILLQQGKSVSGSDLNETALAHQGAQVFLGHSPNNLPSQGRVVVSSGIRQDNPEWLAAKERKLPILHRSELLNQLAQEKKALLVTGTHGKTTTSSLLAWVLTSAGLFPGFSVGGIINTLETNGMHGNGDYFVAEADESDGTHTRYCPFGAIVTNVGLDHMDHYKTKEALYQSMSAFCKKANHLILSGDDPFLSTLPGTFYGEAETCHYRLLDVSQTGWQLKATFLHQGIKTAATINLVGIHNAKNALAVFALCHTLGVDTQAILEGLRTFPGVKRRAQKKVDTKELLYIDDYAHHPTEIKATLSAFKKAEPNRRLIALFQPHRYSRTRDCLNEYPGIFDVADLLIVTDIYAAGEKPLPGIGFRQVISALQHKGVIYIPRESLEEKVKKLLKPGDFVAGLGAGDITKLKL